MPAIDYFKSATNTRNYVAGEVIFNVGDPGDVMYSVREGSVTLYYNDKELETLEAGGLFGEMALIDNAPRSAMAVASTDCVVVPVDRKTFLFLTQETPTFALQVMHAMADRLRRMNTMV